MMGFRLFLRENRRWLGLTVLFVLVAVFNVATGDTLSDVVTWSLILLSLLTQGVVPHSITERAKRATSHGIPTPRSVEEMHSLSHTVSTPLSILLGVFLAILGYAWVAPSNSPVNQFRPLAAFATNVFLVLTIMSYFWSRFLGKIQEERYGDLTGWEILVPMLAVASVTSVISIMSGVAHWEDSIAFYGPIILISLQVDRSIPAQGRISPKFAKAEVERLRAARLELDSRLAWTHRQRDAYTEEEYQAQIKKLEREIADIDTKMTRYRDSLSKYGKVVDGVIDQVSSYQKGRKQREEIVTRSVSTDELTDVELREAMEQSIRLVSPAPRKEPKSCLRLREFDDARQTVTVLNFNLILQTLGGFPPSVTKVEAQPISSELDRSTYESYGPSLVRCTITKHAVAEAAWMWSRTKGMDSAIQCFTSLQDYQQSLKRLRQETRQRINLFEKIVRLDPESDYSRIMKSVRGAKSSLASKLRTLDEASDVVKKACSLLDPYRRLLQPTNH